MKIEEWAYNGLIWPNRGRPKTFTSKEEVKCTKRLGFRVMAATAFP